MNATTHTYPLPITGRPMRYLNNAVFAAIFLFNGLASTSTQGYLIYGGLTLLTLGALVLERILPTRRGRPHLVIKNFGLLSMPIMGLIFVNSIYGRVFWAVPLAALVIGVAFRREGFVAVGPDGMRIQRFWIKRTVEWREVESVARYKPLFGFTGGETVIVRLRRDSYFFRWWPFRRREWTLNVQPERVAEFLAEIGLYTERAPKT